MCKAWRAHLIDATGARQRRYNYLSKVWGFFVILMTSHALAYGQQASIGERPTAAAVTSSNATQNATKVQSRLSLAVSSPDYPVTPGDVYRLSYFQTAENLVSTEVLVDGTSEINLGVFGSINARNMTFTELKHRVEKLIANSYTHSLPSLRIVRPGVFSVAVTGEVNRLQYITAWGLTRLSTIVDHAKDRYSSIRRVEIRTRNGGVRQYDLLKAMRLGDESQDPFVKPGDTVVLVPRGRTITLSGQVRHPGTYELLPGEGLRDLIQEFGGGTTSEANLNRIMVERNLVAQPYVDYVSIPQAYRSSVDLFNGDAVVVTSRADMHSVVWFEGAVSPPLSGSSPLQVEQVQVQPRNRSVSMSTEGQRPARDRFALPIRNGEMLSDVLQEVRNSILPSANLEAAILVRSDESMLDPINLARAMAHPNSADDVPLHPNDTIFIPSLLSGVSVYGAVMTPGFFPFVPGEPATYYIGLAGGVDPERNSNGEYIVTAANGKTQSLSGSIEPGDRVYVPLNAFGYRVRNNAPTFVAIISVILSTATFIYFNVIH